MVIITQVGDTCFWNKCYKINKKYQNTIFNYFESVSIKKKLFKDNTVSNKEVFILAIATVSSLPEQNGPNSESRDIRWKKGKI